MPSRFRTGLRPIIAILLAVGVSACIPICHPTDEITAGYAYRFSANIGPHGDYQEPANTWIDSARMSDFLRSLIEKKGRQALVSERSFQCSPQPATDCPDCLVCSRTVRNVRNHHCQSEGDMFIQAYIGPGMNVRAMTYWRK